MMKHWAVALLILLAAGPALACRQALVLALDVSGSVDATEYRQQVSGLALALSDPDIRQIILSDTGNPVDIMVFEWSSRNHQYVILPWTRLDGAGALDSAIARIQSHRKIRAGLKTALGTALGFAHTMLGQKPDCWQHTIDVSADGYNNVGPAPQTIYSAGFARITVNALVVGKPGPDSRSGALLDYFETDVIRGPGAFAMVANGYGDYARAMKLKLIKELAPPVLGQAGPPIANPG